MSPRRNWDSPNPSPPSERALPSRTKGLGALSPAAKGVGEFQFRRMEKKLSTLPTLWFALSTPDGGEGYNSYTDLNPNTITSLQLQCIQAASPHLADKTTSKPQPKCFMYKSSPHQPPYWTYI
jgi:hypothetical protein